MFVVGDNVIDKDGKTGIVVDIRDIHNIEVVYTGKYSGSGLYCVDKNCMDYDDLKGNSWRDARKVFPKENEYVLLYFSKKYIE